MQRIMQVVEPLSMMSVVSTTHDATNVGNEVNGATKVNEVGQLYGGRWICIGLKWLECSVPGTEEG